nr:MAG TPA: TFIIB zinc-binding [Caudoviricetes sp.]
MNETYTKLRDFAQKRLDDSCENDCNNDIRYWVGYLVGLNALYKELYRTEEALEKQIPKKPYLGEILGYKSYLCPTCRGWLLYPDERPTLGDLFCSFCGQKIDWPEVAE